MFLPENNILSMKCFFWNDSSKCQKRTTCDFYLTLLLRLWPTSAAVCVLDAKIKMTAVIHLNAVFTKENKKAKLYKSMFIYSPWICLLLMHAEDSVLPEKQSYFWIPKFSAKQSHKQLWFSHILNLICLSVCVHTSVWFLLLKTAVLLSCTGKRGTSGEKLGNDSEMTNFTVFP